MTSEVDKNNNAVITIHFRGKVYNTTNSSVNIKDYTKKLSKGLTQALKGKNGKITYTSDVELTVAKSIKEVKKTDHLLVVVDNVEGQADSDEEAGGLAQMNGQIAYVETGDVGWMVQAGIHEIGHNFGFGHSWKDGISDNDDGTNYMDYTNNRSSFSFEQLNSIGNKGALNQGSPVQAAPYTTNNWLWNTSTNSQPWNFNVKKGDLIPTILKN